VEILHFTGPLHENRTKYNKRKRVCQMFFELLRTDAGHILRDRSAVALFTRVMVKYSPCGTQ
jgi:hypothetical protein